MPFLELIVKIYLYFCFAIGLVANTYSNKHTQERGNVETLDRTQAHT